MKKNLNSIIFLKHKKQSIESVKQNDEEPKAKVLKRELKKEIKKEIPIGNGMKLKLPKNKLSGEGGYSSVMKGISFIVHNLQKFHL